MKVKILKAIENILWVLAVVLILLFPYIIINLYNHKDVIVYQNFNDTYGITEKYFGNIVMQDNNKIRLVKKIQKIK